MEFTRQEIEDVAAQLAGIVVRTPLVRCDYLSQMIAGEVFLKLENLQITGSFKPRGAYIKLKSLTPEQKAKGIIAMSAGNHAQGVAYHAARMGISTTIVMPETTPLAKVERTRQLGAKILLSGASLAESEDYALPIAAKENLTVIHPYNDPEIIKGQSTVGLEILQDQPDLDAMIVPVGGGGLSSGICLAREAMASSAKVYGVQSAHCTAMTRRLYPDKDIPVHKTSSQTIAEGIAVKAPGQITYEILKKHLTDIFVVSEDQIESAIDVLAIQQKLVSEGAGAAGVAALMANIDQFRGKKVAVIVCGGNIDSRILSSVLMRGLVHRHQMLRVRVEIIDAPGVLSQVSGVIGQSGGNVIEVHHQRWFNTSAVKMSDLDIIIEIRDEGHGQLVVNALKEAGFPAVAILP